MRIAELRWTRYRIPFKRPLVTAHGVYPFREGAIVEAVTREGVVGVGEIAPPPGFGVSLDEALAALNNVSPYFVGKSAEGVLASLAQTSADMYGWNNMPAVWCGVETALWDVHGKVERRPLSQCFDLPHNDAKASVPVNALISASATNVAADAARQAVASGFRCVKLKVGMGPLVDNEIARIAAIRDAIGPDIYLRIDANEAWDYDQALATLARAAEYDIQYCEQPLRRDDIAGLRALRLDSPVRIAADESAESLDARIRILQSEAVDILVIKLQSQGGIWEARLNMRHRMSRQEVECVVTSSLESGIGVTAALHVAAATPEMTLECGLATLDLLEDDLIVEPPRIEGGAMLVPEGPGLGVELDRAALARYAV